MTNIMLATDDELYKGLNEFDEILNDIHKSGTQAAEMTVCRNNKG